jgi:hypothetical protein
MTIYAGTSEARIVKRSELPPNLQSATKEQIIDYMRLGVLAHTYRLWTKHLHPKLTLKQRMAFAVTTQIEVIDDIPTPPALAEPRELILKRPCDSRYKDVLPILRSNLPPHWRDAPTSLIMDYVRMMVFAQGFEIYTATDISWKSREAYAFQAPLELYDDTDCMNIQHSIDEECYDGLSNQEKRLHDKYRFFLLGSILETHRKQNEWTTS